MKYKIALFIKTYSQDINACEKLLQSIQRFNKDVFPKEPLFKVFHYKKQYQDFVKEGHTIDSIKENYLGIVMQSNWMKQQKWYHRKTKW